MSVVCRLLLLSSGVLRANVDGVNVSFRFYQDTLETWYELGVTPVTNVRLPYAYLQLKFENEGEEHTTWTHPYYILEGSNKFILPPPGTEGPSPQYVQKMGAKSRLSFPGLDHLDHVEFAPFELAKKEVTNQEYLEFVHAGRRGAHAAGCRDGHGALAGAAAGSVGGRVLQSNRGSTGEDGPEV